MKNGKRLTMMKYYSYQIAYRNGSSIHRFRKLYQQYVVDGFCKVQENNLNYIRNNQKNLRAESYAGLLEHLQNEAVANDVAVGRRVILPSTFNGGPRNMMQLYQDSMASVAKFGKPDIFLTFTCNPGWPEIKEVLINGQTYHDRPDIISRVFKMKLDELSEDLFTKNIFGRVKSHIGVIEFQKRGLPHAHFLITMEEGHKFDTKASIDALISAEIPDPIEDPITHELCLAHMIHGPCGSHNPSCPCMKEGKCVRQYPKPFVDETELINNAYPTYRRRSNGPTAKVGKHDVDNRWVVPHNRFLLRKYNCHINIEICSSIKCVKYLHKYIFKGHDAAALRLITGDGVLNYDEISAFLDARYLGAPEASWRLFRFPMHMHSHAVIRLTVHLENQQSLLFADGEEETAIDSASTNFTTLTGYFALNAKVAHTVLDPNDSEDPRNYRYADLPYHFVFDKQKGWSPRQRKTKVIGRMHFVSPRDVERYYLRILLLHQRGATSYEGLRMVNGVLHPTFKSAAQALGLIDDDSEADNVLQECSLKYTPAEMRQVFADLLVFSTPTDAQTLWDKYKNYMIEDIMYKHGDDEASAVKTIYVLIDTIVDDRVSFRDLIKPPENIILRAKRSLMPALSDMDASNIQSKGVELYNTLNQDQKRIADVVLSAVEGDSELPKDSFFVDGPGGSGKTYLYETLNYLLSSRNKKVVNVAWSGIAAQLLPSGKTSHSVFKLPVPVTRDNYMPMVKVNSRLAENLREIDVFIWDEISMTPKFAIEGVDAMLRDIMNSESPFGGKTMIFGGDFRQISPITEESTDCAVVEASVKSSKLWNTLRKFTLTENMRAAGESEGFRNFVLQIGNGKVVQTENGKVSIPPEFISKGDLIHEIYGDDINILTTEEISMRAILCPKNIDCLETNMSILHKIRGGKRIYYSKDEAVVDPGDHNYPDEFINSVTPPGMPHHELHLKVGAIVMLLRNLNVNAGLCNGTRMVVEELNDHTIKCRTLVSKQSVVIPRIDMTPCSTDLPFILKRRQFPIRLCFALTIHKSQGQSFEKVGVYLSSPLFCHGHLYVALSRCKKENGLKIFIPNGETETDNIVIPALLS